MEYDTTYINDSLVTIGKKLRERQENIKHVSERVSENLPIIEKTHDRVGTLYIFRMEFFTYTDRPLVTLDINFFPKFISPFYLEG